MEVSGVCLRPSPWFSGAGFDTHSSKLPFSSTNCDQVRLSNHGLRSRNYEVSRLGFSDSGHLQYYVSPKSAIKEKEKKQRKNPETKALKKKLKLVKGMSKDLLRFSSMGLCLGGEEVKGKSISEATEILLAQLQQLKAEEKELKKRKKEEKAKLKIKAAKDVESSTSSSSESSDSEGGEVIDMTSLRAGAITEPNEIPSVEERVNFNAEASTSSSCRGENSAMLAGSPGKIEICMGGKCKKSGAPALLEEFQQRVGIEGAVVGCKCMGKCRDGPNVRIVNQCDGDAAGRNKLLDGVRHQTQTNPLCIGVGLDDVGMIVSNFFGGEKKEVGLMVA